MEAAGQCWRPGSLARSHKVIVCIGHSLHEGWRHGSWGAAYGCQAGLSAQPTLFGVFFDGLHQHMSAVAPESGLMLNSGRRVPFLCCADHVVLLSDTSWGWRILIDSMHGFCVGVGLTISVAKTEVVGLHWAGTQDSQSLHGLA